MSKGDTICGRHIPSCLLMSDLKLTPVCKNSVGDEEKNTGHLTFCLKLTTTWCKIHCAGYIYFPTSTCFTVVFIWEVQIGDVCFQNAIIIILKHVYCFCWCKNLCRRSSFVPPPPIFPQFSLGSGHSGYIVVYSAQYISSSKQNKKSGNKETLCSHTAWELKTNIPPHQIYINW